MGAALFGALFYLTNLDATVDHTRLSGTVEAVERFVAGKGGWRVGVMLDDGRHIFVVAGKDKQVHPGDPIQVSEHHHHTGRTTFSSK